MAEFDSLKRPKYKLGQYVKVEVEGQIEGVRLKKRYDSRLGYEVEEVKYDIKCPKLALAYGIAEENITIPVGYCLQCGEPVNNAEGDQCVSCGGNGEVF